jgi:hypothetical protein
MARAVFFGVRRTRLAVPLFAAFAAASTLGCSSSDSLKKQISGLETQITAMRADQDRLEERLAAVELSSAVPSRTAPPTSASAKALEHPRLKVIHLSPDQVGGPPESVDGPSSAAPEGAGERPTIRGTGDRIIKTGDGDRGGESTQNDETPARPVAQLGKGPRGN